MARRTDIADVLRAEGLTVVEYPGWQTRGGVGFNPVGVIAHHTAGSANGDAPSLKLCVNGRSDLKGPLCHVVLARSGVCYVIAAGVANHAGTGSWKGVSGNRSFFGIEAENTGVGEPWPAVQLDAFTRCTAALLRSIGKGAEWAAGHKEYAPKRKIDPAGIHMGWFRDRVAEHLAPAAPSSPKESRMFASIVAALQVAYRYPQIIATWDKEQRDAALWWFDIAREHGEENTLVMLFAEARKDKALI